MFPTPYDRVALWTSLIAKYCRGEVQQFSLKKLACAVKRSPANPHAGRDFSGCLEAAKATSRYATCLKNIPPDLNVAQERCLSGMEYPRTYINCLDGNRNNSSNILLYFESASNSYPSSSLLVHPEPESLSQTDDNDSRIHQ